jgi:hypothetical protein
VRAVVTKRVAQNRFGDWMLASTLWPWPGYLRCHSGLSPRHAPSASAVSQTAECVSTRLT